MRTLKRGSWENTLRFFHVARVGCIGFVSNPDPIPLKSTEDDRFEGTFQSCTFAGIGFKLE
jgi:hypothetical protein